MRDVPHPPGELVQLRGAFRQPVRLPVEEQLQPVLDLAQEAVRVVEGAVLLVRQAPGRGQRLQRRQRGALPHRGQVAAVEQLQELHGELDVADAAAAGLDVALALPGVARLALHPPLHRLDLVDLRGGQVAAVDERLQGVDQLLAQGAVAGDGAELDQRLPLPGAAEVVVVGQRAGQRPGQRAALPLGAQAQVHAVRLPAVGVGRQQPHHLPDQPGEELVVAQARAPAAGRAVRVVDEHQVDVAGVVQLLAAELAERQHGAAGRPPVGGVRLAEALDQAAAGGAEGDLQGDVGGAGQLAGDLLQRPVTDDVVGTDAQELPLPEAPERPQDGRVLVGGIDLALELAEQLLRAGGAAQRLAQRVEEVGVGDERVGEELAGAQQVQQRLQPAGAVFEEGGHLLGDAGPGEEALQVVQRHVRVGGARQQARKRREQLGDPPRPGVLAQPAEVAVAALEVGEPPALEKGAGGVEGVRGARGRIRKH